MRRQRYVRAASSSTNVPIIIIPEPDTASRRNVRRKRAPARAARRVPSSAAARPYPVPRLRSPISLPTSSRWLSRITASSRSRTDGSPSPTKKPAALGCGHPPFPPARLAYRVHESPLLWLPVAHRQGAHRRSQGQSRIGLWLHRDRRSNCHPGHNRPARPAGDDSASIAHGASAAHGCPQTSDHPARHDPQPMCSP